MRKKSIVKLNLYLVSAEITHITINNQASYILIPMLIVYIQGIKIKKQLLIILAAVSVMAAGCSSMNMGLSSAKTSATGSAGGGSAQDANSKLERCDESLGTLAVVEDTSSGWFRILKSETKLDPTTPVLRLLVQQSNCFVVVERGRTMSKMAQERALESSGDLRAFPDPWKLTRIVQFGPFDAL